MRIAFTEVPGQLDPDVLAVPAWSATPPTSPNGRLVTVRTDPKREALVALHAEQYGSLVRTATWLVGERGLAEELVQEGFVKLAQSWDSLKDPGAAGAYLRRTVINLCNSRLRRVIVGRRKLERVGQTQPLTDESAADLGSGLLDGDLGRSIKKLTARQRACVVLRFEQDMTVEQIADALELAPGSVKSHLHRALKRIRTDLEQGASS